MPEESFTVSIFTVGGLKTAFFGEFFVEVGFFFDLRLDDRGCALTREFSLKITSII